VDHTPDALKSLQLSKLSSPASIARCAESRRALGPHRVSPRREGIDDALAALPERQRRVIELRFGLHGGQPRTLDEVGRTFGVTRERIRQIENDMLKTLASLPEAERLNDCI
jgi:RNA polymerase sigma factor (sigma-70 family)